MAAGRLSEPRLQDSSGFAYRLEKTRYPLAIFLGAFLLFLVQPMAGKHVLPRFGGGAGVWTACLLFFQVLLLAGYAYAHFASRWPPIVHAGVTAAAVLSLPLFAGSWVWSSGGSGLTDPVVAILVLLTIAIGLPYLLLASTGPLLQSWLWSASGEQSPYRLYALSNAASFLALLAYPVLIEPWMSLRTQVWIWCAIFVCYAAVMIWCALAARPSAAPASSDSPVTRDILYWIALAACGSTLLLAATNHMCQEIAVIPFLWIAPLALYLATFVLSFERPGFYRPMVFGGLAIILIPLNCWFMTRETPRPYWQDLAVDAATLAVCCMICHGQLARSRPAPRYLTWFYLCIAAGGALGGVLVAVIAPRIFTDYREFPLGLAACAMLAAGAMWRAMPKRWLAFAMAAVAVAGLGTAVKLRGGGDLVAARNFYGVLRVKEYRNGPIPLRTLVHGRTIHGTQMIHPVLKHWATTYYDVSSAIGLAFEHHPRRLERGLKVGAIGLGAGTIAALGKAGDTIRFYEINPDVIRIAQDSFSYLKDSYAAIDMVEGDARIRLEEEASRNELQSFDVLAVDAFNSDSVPAHLLTVECARLYRRHLQPDGVLLFHISNKALDLAPVTRAMAAELAMEEPGWTATLFSSELAPDVPRVKWMVLTRSEKFLKNPAVVLGMDNGNGNIRTVRWTDDFTSLWHVFKF